MGNKKAKNKRKSELKIIFFIILVAAALFIVSTYAWFSTQKNVAITNLEGKVEVAEGLEISLDGAKWSNEIKLGKDDASDTDTILSITDDAYPKHRNLSPSELLPVSTLGLVGKNMTDLKMLRGKSTNTIKLEEIIATSETQTDSEEMDYAGYFAFDIFLKNSSKQNDKDDILQLDNNSSLQIIEGGNDTVGLQNTVRVGFAKYATGELDTGTGTRAGVADVMANQEAVLTQTGAADFGSTKADTVYISDVAIWEPNANDHAEYIVTNNNQITWSKSVGANYGTWQDVDGGTDTNKAGHFKFTTTTKMPTYALVESLAGSTTVIEDIYVWDGTVDHLQQQVTLQTTKKSADDYTAKEGVENLISTSDASGSTPFSIAPNSIVRVRVYVWLEGQDVDCINYASHGGGVIVDIGIVKGIEDPDADDIT